MISCFIIHQISTIGHRISSDGETINASNLVSGCQRKKKQSCRGANSSSITRPVRQSEKTAMATSAPGGRSVSCIRRYSPRFPSLPTELLRPDPKAPGPRIRPHPRGNRRHRHPKTHWRSRCLRSVGSTSRQCPQPVEAEVQKWETDPLLSRLAFPVEDCWSLPSRLSFRARRSEIAELLDGCTKDLSRTAYITHGMFRILHRLQIGSANWMNVSRF